MEGQILSVGSEGTQVDDPFQSGRGGGVPEVTGSLTVLGSEIPGALHPVDQVVGGVASGEGGMKGAGTQDITGDDLDLVSPRVEGEPIRVPSHAPHIEAPCQ